MTKISRKSYHSLRELYADIPDAHCKGLCGPTHCTRVLASRAEMRNARQAGVDLTSTREELIEGMNGSLSCQAFSPAKGCLIYEARPLICRIWGASIELICPHGCRPSRYLTAEESRHMVSESIRLGGAHSMMDTLGKQVQ